MVVLVVAAWLSPLAAADLAHDLGPLWDCVSGKREAFCIDGTLRLPARPDGRSGDIVRLQFARYDAAAFDVEATHPDHAFILRRRATATALALPRHGRVYGGRGDVNAADHLPPAGVARLVSADSAARSSSRPSLTSRP